MLLELSVYINKRKRSTQKCIFVKLNIGEFRTIQIFTSIYVDMYSKAFCWNTPFIAQRDWVSQRFLNGFLYGKPFACVLYSMVVWYFSFHYVHAYNVMYYECKNQRSKVSFIYTRPMWNSSKAMYSKQSYIANSICLELERGFR